MGAAREHSILTILGSRGDAQDDLLSATRTPIAFSGGYLRTVETWVGVGRTVYRAGRCLAVGPRHHGWSPKLKAPEEFTSFAVS